MPMVRPQPSEAADYYFRYIDRVPDGDVRQTLRTQRDEVLEFLKALPANVTTHRYAEGKWSVAEVLGHLNDTERLFGARAFWFARGFESPMPSFDQEVAMANARFPERSWTSLVEEFRAVREATLAFYDSLPAEAWDRRGIASDNPFTVRALAYLTVGHVIHHTDIVQHQYLAR